MSRRATRFAPILILLATLFATSSTGLAQDGARRIITIGGDITEIVYSLGEQMRLVARDSTSTYPPEAEKLHDIGYFRQLGAEGVLSLNPDLILASAAAGPPEVLEQIASAGVQIVRLPESDSAAGLLAKVERIAKLLGVAEKGEALRAKLREGLAAAMAEIAAMPDRPKVLFIINSGGGAPMAAGRDTAAHALIELAAGSNVFESHKGYKAISLEAAAASAPQAIAMMEHTLKSLGGVSSVAEHPALRLTPAAKHKRISYLAP